MRHAGHAGARHRRQHHHLQRRQRRRAAATPLPGGRSPRLGAVGRSPQPVRRQPVVPEFLRHSPAHEDARAHRQLSQHRLHPDRTRPARAPARPDCLVGILPDARRQARSRPRLRPGRRAARRPGRGPEPRHVDQKLRRRPCGGGPGNRHRRRAARGRRRGASRVLLPNRATTNGDVDDAGARRVIGHAHAGDRATRRPHAGYDRAARAGRVSTAGSRRDGRHRRLVAAAIPRRECQCSKHRRAIRDRSDPGADARWRPDALGHGRARAAHRLCQRLEPAGGTHLRS